MNSVSLTTSRGRQGLLACIVLLLSAFSGVAQGTVTYQGKNGVANWLTGSAAANNVDCISCHDGATAPDFRTEAAAQSYASSMVNRLSLPPSDSLCMPQGACGTVSPDEIQQWINAAYALHAAPAANQNVAASTAPATNATSVTKTTASLNGSVNANGLASSYWFEWGLDDGGSSFSHSTSHVSSSDAGGSPFTSNGGLYAEQVSAAISGITCGTHYQFRIVASNADSGTPTHGGTVFFQTASCTFPVVSFGGSQVTGTGTTLTIPVALTGGGSTDYQWPVVLHYQLSGTAAAGDYGLSSADASVSVDTAAATITINSGTSGNVQLHVTGNTNQPADEFVTITLNPSATANATVPNPSAYTAVISGSAAAAPPPLQVSQGSPAVSSQFIYKNQGVVTVSATGSTGAGAAYDWSATDSRLVPIAGSPANEFRFDPAALSAGTYVVAVAINDAGSITHQHVTVALGNTPPTLSTSTSSDGDSTADATEGRGDVDGDGLPDYLDPTGDPTLLNETVSPTASNLTRLITTTAGLSLALNDSAIQALAEGKASGAKIPASSVNSDAGYSVIDGVYDFQVRGLSATQPTAKVVIPLGKPLPSGVVFRKFANGAWADFAVTATDDVRSARSLTATDECPPPGDAAYREGLLPFNDCIELTLTDGGPNDSDGEANGVIRDPGAIVTASAASDGTPSVPTSAPGGAGAVDGWWLLLMLPLWMRRRRIRRG